jgi:hypothetical protein
VVKKLDGPTVGVALVEVGVVAEMVREEAEAASLVDFSAVLVGAADDAGD